MLKTSMLGQKKLLWTFGLPDHVFDLSNAGHGAFLCAEDS